MSSSPGHLLKVQSEKYTFLGFTELTMPSSHSLSLPSPVKGTKPVSTPTLPSPHVAKSCQICRSPELLPNPSPPVLSLST